MEQGNTRFSYESNSQGLGRVLVYAVLVLLVIFLATSAYTKVRESRGMLPHNTISISGEGSVFAKPDIGQVNLTVIREGKTVAEAQKAATEGANAVVGYLKSAGIEEKDIKTISYNLNPRYDYTQNGGRVDRGYEVVQTFDVKIRNLDKAGDILAGAAEKGANQVSGLNFTIDNPDTLNAQAREDAIRDAKEKAEKLADQLGVRLGRIVSFSESSGGYPPVPMYYKGMGGAVAQDSASVAPATPTGENEIVSNVTIIYEIR